MNPQEYQFEVENDIIVSHHVLKIIKICGEKDIEEINTCPICFVKDSEVITGCKHQYCKDCFREYINTQRDEYDDIKCPYCRQTNMELYYIKKK